MKEILESEINDVIKKYLVKNLKLQVIAIADRSGHPDHVTVEVYLGDEFLTESTAWFERRLDG